MFDVRQVARHGKGSYAHPLVRQMDPSGGAGEMKGLLAGVFVKAVEGKGDARRR